MRIQKQPKQLEMLIVQVEPVKILSPFTWKLLDTKSGFLARQPTSTMGVD